MNSFNEPGLLLKELKLGDGCMVHGKPEEENQRRQDFDWLFVQEKPGELKKKNKDVNRIDEMYHDTETNVNLLNLLIAKCV